jgi:2-oxoglutarate dehydrogenase complex dehydrogenase (E1) component-like enzyme
MYNKIAESQLMLAVKVAVLTKLLIEKGICSKEEIDNSFKEYEDALIEAFKKSGERSKDADSNK